MKVTETEFHELQRLAAECDQSTSDFLRAAINEYAARLRKGK